MNERWLWSHGFHLEEYFTEPPTYDPALERLDVAVRAVFRDCQKRRGALLLEGGIEVEGLLPLVDAMSYPASEEQVFKVPYPILAAAQEVLRLYAAKFADDRFIWYQVIRKEPYVVRVPR